MFVDLVVPQNIFFDAKSGKIRISLKTFWKKRSQKKTKKKKKESLQKSQKKKGNNQLEIIYNFVKKYMKM